MRLRKQRGAREKLLSYSKHVITQEKASEISMADEFGMKRPLRVEIGTGKGKFLTTHAMSDANSNYLGIECKEEVLLKAAQKADDKDIENLRFIIGDASKIGEYFAGGEVERLFINFCDPWPKRRHAKRRLVHKRFLNIYKRILAPQGHIEFKTDNEKLFEFALNEFSDNGFRLKSITFDLQSSEYEGNVTTEYEDKFMQKGMKIFRCEAHKTE